jgi:hypothetical protein
MTTLATALRGRGPAVALALTATAALALATTVRPNWGIGRHGTSLLEVPPLPVGANALVVTTDGEPHGYLVPSLPSGVRVLGLRTNFHHPEQDHGLNRRIRQRIADHPGPFVVIHAPTATGQRDAVLAVHRLALDGPCALIATSLVPGGHSFCPARRLD